MGVLYDYKHSPPTRRVLTCLIDIICPPEVRTLNLVDSVLNEVELSLRALPPLPRRGILAGIRAYETTSRTHPSHFGKRASALSDEKAQRYFDKWRQSRLPAQRQFIKGIRGLICIGYYELPIIQKRLGYTPQEWIEKQRAHRLQTFPHVITAHEAALLAPDPLPLGGASTGADDTTPGDFR